MTYSKKELKKIHVPQLGEHTCGLACISAIANYYHGDVSQEHLRNISGTTLNGTTLLGLYQAARQIGFEAAGCESDMETLKSLDQPVILHVVLDDNRQHFIVNYGFQNGKFMIGDPGWGIVEYSEEELESVWSSGALLKLTPGSGFETTKRRDRGQFRWFKSLIHDDIPILSVAAVIGVFTAALGLSTAIFTQKLIDDFLPNYETNKILIETVVLALLLLARSFLGYIRGIFMARQGKELNVRIVDSFLEKIIYLPLTLFRGFSTGDLVARMNDSMRIRNTVALVTGEVLIDLLVVMVSSVYIFMLSVELGLLSIAGILFFSLTAWHFHPKILEYQREVMTAHANNEVQYIDSISGIASIKSFNKETVFKDRIRAVYDYYQSKGYQLAILGNTFGFITQLFVSIFITLFFGFGVWQVLENRILLGELMAVLTLSGSIIPSLAGLMLATIQIQEAKVAFSRLYEISSLDKEYEPAPGSGITRDPLAKHSLSIEDLAFRFPGRRTLLNDVNLRLETGKTVTLFGEVGSGKSTLVDIIQGFYGPEKGQILIDRKGIHDFGVEMWRSLFGVVSQSGKIFNTTVLDNICLDNDPNKADMCINFLNECGFLSCIDRLPQGLFTVCGEDGRNLSGGQQQLVAIARALYKKPAFLILDESTSAMDFDTENNILRIINRITRNHQMGVLLVTHRISLARLSGTIYILQNGSIHDTGTHQELIHKNNNYARGYHSMVSFNA